MVAKYRHIAETLRRQIEAGDWPSGAKLPTVTELGRHFGVDRNTAHHAIRVLEEAGYVTATQGSGTIVRHNPVPRLRENSAIVFIAQIGTPGDSWKPVIDLLDSTAKTFTYDRPGIGPTPPRPAPNPALSHGVFARELADLLDADGITEPAVVVGHSFGGSIARVFAGLYPQRVAGLVFVDSSIPQTFLHPMREAVRDGDGPDATEIDTVRGQVDILSVDLPAVPDAVITRTPGVWSGDEPPPHPAVEDLWLIHQQLLARQLGCPLIVADNSGHQIVRNLPGLVAYATDVVVEAARDGGTVQLDQQRVAELGARLTSVRP